MKTANGVVVFLVGGIVAVVGCAILGQGCALFQSPAVQAEGGYTAELLACTAEAKATDAGRAGSEACERAVDLKWGVFDGGR